MYVKDELDKLTAQVTSVQARIKAGLTTSQLVGFIPMLYAALLDAENLCTAMREHGRDLVKSVAVDGAPLPPIDLTAELIQSPSSIDLEWIAGEGGSIEGHRVYRSVDGGAFVQAGLDIPTPTVTYSDDDVENDHVYQYYVVAYNASDESLPADNTVTIIT